MSAEEYLSSQTVESLDWEAVFSVPSSLSRVKRAERLGRVHRQKPDRDNLDKAILDALFRDDSGVGCGTLLKSWGEEGLLRVRVVFGEGA